jgi:hypothetical protein
MRIASPKQNFLEGGGGKGRKKWGTWLRFIEVSKKNKSSDVKEILD